MSNGAKIGLAVSVLALAGIIAFALSRGPASSLNAPPNSAYFYVLSSGKVFMDTEPSTAEPVTAREGGAAVRAYLFSCGDCGNEHYVGYVERLRPEVLEALDPGDPLIPQVLGPHGLSNDNLHEVALVEGPPADWQWHVEDSAEARAVRERAVQQCDGRSATPCVPGTVSLP